MSTMKDIAIACMAAAQNEPGYCFIPGSVWATSGDTCFRELAEASDAPQMLVELVAARQEYHRWVMGPAPTTNEASAARRIERRRIGERLAGAEALFQGSSNGEETVITALCHGFRCGSYPTCAVIARVGESYRGLI